MIDMAPTDVNCINSLMHYVVDMAKKHGRIPVLTFDQPLYWKALNIQCSDQKSILSSLVLLLGQFHARMCFVSAIGTLLMNTGLEFIIALVYADNTG